MYAGAPLRRVRPAVIFFALQKAAQKRLQLPEDFVLVLDFEGSDLTEKPGDPITKVCLLLNV